MRSRNCSSVCLFREAFFPAAHERWMVGGVLEQQCLFCFWMEIPQQPTGWNTGCRGCGMTCVAFSMSAKPIIVSKTQSYLEGKHPFMPGNPSMHRARIDSTAASWNNTSPSDVRAPCISRTLTCQTDEWGNDFFKSNCKWSGCQNLKWIFNRKRC